MYYIFPAECSYKQFVHKLKQCSSDYIFLMCSFSGSYISMITKQRYMQARFYEHIPLFILDIRRNSRVYLRLQQLFPKVFLFQKMPMHICFKRIYDKEKDKLFLQPMMYNAAVLGDHHFDQLLAILPEDTLEKPSRVVTLPKQDSTSS